MAKRAEVLESQDREKWITEANRKKILNWLKDKPKSHWEKLSNEFDDYHESILTLATKAGIINPTLRKYWTEDYYVPFYRIFEDEQTREELIRGPFTSKKHIDARIKKLMGAERKMGDPLENIMKNWTHLINESMRNVARSEAFESSKKLNLNVIEEVSKKDLAKILGTKIQTRYAVMKDGAEKASNLFDDKGEAEAWSGHLADKYNKTYHVVPRKTQVTLFGLMQDNNLLSFQRGGERVYFRVNDPELFNAMSNANKKDFDNIIMKMFRTSKRWLTYGATFGPAFRIANMLRDTLHTAVISKSFYPFLDSFKGAVKAYREDPDMIKLAASGGSFGSSYVRADDAETLTKYINRITKKESKGATTRIIDSVQKALDWWEMVGSASENAARVSLYAKRREEGVSHLKSAFEARDLLDFTMRGDAGAIQFLIQMIPFMNARMQGNYKLGRAAYENPKSFAIKGGMITAATMLLWAFNQDDDRYKELEDWDKWTYYHFWIGDQHYRVPKPFEVGAIFSSAFESAADAMTDNEDIWHIADYVKHTFRDTFAINPFPQLVRPLVEQWFNENLFTGRPIEGERLKALVPSERADVWTSETAQVIGKATGKLGFGPKRVEALVQGYLSTFGQFIFGITDSMLYHFLDFPTEPTKRIDDYPLIGRFIKRKVPARHTKYKTRFYESMKELDALVGTVNFYKKTGDLKKAKELMGKNRHKLRARKRLNKIRTKLRKVNAQVRRIYYSKLSPDKKRKLLDGLTKRSNELSKRAYDIISSEGLSKKPTSKNKSISRFPSSNRTSLLSYPQGQGSQAGGLLNYTR